MKKLLTLLLIPAAVLAQTRDFGDLPETSSYATRASNDGPSHFPSSDLHIGPNAADAEADGIPNTTATSDDNTGADESSASFTITQDSSSLNSQGFIFIRIDFQLRNTTGSGAELRVFADLNGDGAFSSVNPNDPETSTIPVNSGGIINQSISYGLPSSFFPVSGDLIVPIRLRISSQNGLGFNGSAPDGEIEDHLLNFGSLSVAEGFDFGDFPDSGPGTGPGDFSSNTPPNYRSLLSDDGPRHQLLSGLHIEQAFPFGIPVDSEPDAQVNDTATGDDGGPTGPDQNNDELAGFPSIANFGLNITSNAPLLAQLTGTFQLPIATTNLTGDDAYLNAWVDLNFDGDFDPSEAITTGTGLVVSGNQQPTTLAIPFSFPTPAVCELVAYPLHFPIRIRLSSIENLGPTGEAPDGEVVDTLYTIPVDVSGLCSGAPDYGDFPDAVSGTAPGSFINGALPDYQVRFEDGGPYHFPIPGLAFSENTSQLPDREPNGQPSPDATGDLEDEEGLLSFLTNIEVVNVISSPLSAQINLEVGVNLPVLNTTGVNAFITAWVDQNLNGDFEDSEQLTLDANGIIPGNGSVDQITLSFPWSIQSNEVCRLDEIHYFPLRCRISTTSGLGPNGGGLGINGEVEDHLLSARITTSDFCLAGASRQALTELTGNALLGAPLQIEREAFIPEPYLPSLTDPVWYLDRLLLGSNPTLTEQQLSAINDGTVILWAAPVEGTSGIAPIFPILDSPALLTQLISLGLTGEDLAPYRDPDADSYNTLTEFALGSNPTLPGSLPELNTLIQNDRLGILFLRRTGGTNNGENYTADGVSYCAEASNDLISWFEMINPAAVPAGLSTPPDGYEWAFESRDSLEGENTESFIRLKISPE